MLLIGVDETDETNDADWLIKKIIDLRIFSDENGKMNLSVKIFLAKYFASVNSH